MYTRHGTIFYSNSTDSSSIIGYYVLALTAVVTHDNDLSGGHDFFFFSIFSTRTKKQYLIRFCPRVDSKNSTRLRVHGAFHGAFQ